MKRFFEVMRENIAKQSTLSKIALIVSIIALLKRCFC